MFARFCQWIIKVMGWHIEGQLPLDAKYMVIVGPHTSNWDFFIGILTRAALGQRIHFLAKHQLFLPPWGWFFKAIGGSPVDRRAHHNLVDAAVAHFANHKEYKLALTPEGTRSEVTRWKTGFYHIAKQANVAIVPVGLDFTKRQIIIGNSIYPSHDIKKDMTTILNFYRHINGKYPKTIPEYPD